MQAGIPGAGLRGNRRRAAYPLHLTWCAVRPASHKYRWRSTMPERPPECASTSARKPGGRFTEALV